MGYITNRTMKYYIARNKDGKLYKFPYWEGMTATDVPHRHVSCYPFDGNYYVQDANYMPKRGEEISSELHKEVTYENSPKLIEQ